MSISSKSFVRLATLLALLPISFASFARSPDLLSYIPADSPYVMAMTKPFPDKVIEKFEPTTERMLHGYQTILRESMKEHLEEIAEEDGAKSAEKLIGLINEITGLMSLDGLRGAGLETDSLFALYGHGLTPVFRAQLSSESKFDEAMQRVEEKAESSLKVAEAAGESYKYAEFDKMRLIIATMDSQLVVTVAPNDYDEDQIAALLGADKPRNNIKRARTLSRIEREYDYSGYMTGYFDNVAIANTFLGERNDLDAALFETLMPEAAEREELTDTCKSEILDLARVAPRMVFGYRTINTSRMDSSFVIELRDDIAQGLATLPAAVAGLGQDAGGLLSFGTSLNPKALFDFITARLDALENDPYECDKLAPLQEAVPKGREMLAQPIPPVVYGFRGFVANVFDIEGMDIANDIPPTSVDASVLFAMENVEALLMMGAMFDPQIAALNLLPDGNPVELTMPQIAETVGQAFAAMTENSLSIAMGTDAEDRSVAALSADSASPPPFMSMAFDAARYYGFIGEAMMMAEPEEGEDAPPPEVQAAIQDLMLAGAEIYDRIAVDVLFTERGVEMDGRIALTD